MGVNSSQDPGFNGAARVRTRIFRPVAGSTALKNQLQWGRPFEDGMLLVFRGRMEDTFLYNVMIV